MTEDFIYEEEVDSGGSSNRRPFLTAVGILVTIFVLAVICSAALLINRGRENGDGDGASAQVAAIETQNAVIAVTNAAVTQTIVAMETEAARPTETPVPPPTNTPKPTNTPQPTDTPVVQQAEDDAAASATAASLESTSGEAAEEDSTPTPIAALSSGDSSGSSTGSDSSSDDTLPQTGIETWGIFVAAFGLIAALVAARRLRTS
jgi:hypothetical protein